MAQLNPNVTDEVQWVSAVQRRKGFFELLQSLGCSMRELNSRFRILFLRFCSR
jgi:hypothetical protein